MENNKKFRIIRDTREKERNGWFWEPSEFCLGTESHKLDTGDYSIQGLETQVVIERKFGASELAKNIFEKRFPDCLSRLSKIPHSFIIIECPFQDILDYPYIKSMPRSTIKHIQVNGKLLLKKLCEIQFDYKIQMLFADNNCNAWELANSIFKRGWEKYGCK